MSQRRIDIPLNGETLAGSLSIPFESPSRGVLLLHPHPRFGGSMDNMVVLELEQTAMDAGMAALRFDFRGAPSNPFAYAGPKGAVDDALAAYRKLRKELGIDQIGIMGYSFGASIALSLAKFASPAFVVSLSASMDIFRETGADIESLSTLECPCLLFHGTNDSVISPRDVETLGHHIGDNSEVVKISGEGHFYQQSINQVRIRIKEFLSSLGS